MVEGMLDRLVDARLQQCNKGSYHSIAMLEDVSGAGDSGGARSGQCANFSQVKDDYSRCSLVTSNHYSISPTIWRTGFWKMCIAPSYNYIGYRKIIKQGPSHLTSAIAKSTSKVDSKTDRETVHS